jgi:Protein of unknown function (DUF1592)/Protein of unknown function (DUF1588)/Protein of unknown function (DUF1587)/Protein of unknown function (DUF1595)/Protein of unknown function (DUF1585)
MHSARARRLHPTLALTFGFVAGCTASAGGGGRSGGAGAPAGMNSGGNTATGGRSSSSGSGGSTGGSPSTGSTGSGGDDGALAACPTSVITPTPLRRLTRFEYANTVRDLLKVDASAANDLPVDEVTDGFDNNAGVLTVSSLHAEKYVLVSETLAAAAVKNLSALTTCDTGVKGEDACALDFARTFGRRAFRRPTTSQDEQILMTAYSAGRVGGSYSEGIEVMIRAALQSTNFLYRLELTPPPVPSSTPLVPLSQYEMATRLSYMLWSSGPDDALLDAAARGALGNKDSVAAKAREMLADMKARPAISDFYDQWMSTSRLDIITKDHTLFPRYSADVQTAMAAELPAFVQYVLWGGGDRTLKTLLTSQVGFVNPALAPVYGVTAPTGTDLTMVTLPANQGRAGILTQAGFLAVQAHPDQTSPVLRGKFVRAKLMCNPPPPPPPNANITPPDVNSAGTARERFSAHLTAGSACSGCHQMMDPIGLTFENFDAIGSYRDKDNGKTIDTSGMIVGATEPALMGSFTGVRQLADKLAASRQVSDCVATQWFRFASGRSEETPDGCSLTTLHDAFAKSGNDLIELIIGTTQTDAFWYRAPTTP